MSPISIVSVPQSTGNKMLRIIIIPSITNSLVIPWLIFFEIRILVNRLLDTR